MSELDGREFDIRIELREKTPGGYESKFITVYPFGFTNTWSAANKYNYRQESDEIAAKTVEFAARALGQFVLFVMKYSEELDSSYERDS